MSKRAKPLRAGRGRSRSDRETVSTPTDARHAGYPFEDISNKLNVNVSARAKRMALRLDPQRQLVHLVVPKRATMRSAYLFAEENRDWIREKISGLPRPVPFRDGSVLPVFGRERRIVVLYNPALKFTDIQLKKDEILVLTNKPDPSVRIRRFLMELAKEKISALSYEKAAIIRRKINEIQVRDTRSRWGSCSEDGHLSYSWRLIFAPPKALDYVVGHEVAHLLHMDHSGTFWDACARLCKDYDFGKSWMRDNGHDLMRFGME